MEAVPGMGNKVNGRVALSGLALLTSLAMAGCGSSSSTSSNGTATPSFSPGGGSYNTSQTVTISDTTPGAVLYCTTDGTTPTDTSPQCSQPTTVFKTEFLQAIAVAPGKSPSAVGSAGYTIDLNAAATPTFLPAGGTYTSTQTVTIADATAGANIYYTVDGTVPTAASMLYTGPVIVSKTQTLSAIAVASGFNNSGVASAVFVINPLTATPTFSPAAGTYPSTQMVSLSDATSGASIYYTVDGSVPTAASTLYAGPISVAQTETVNAIAVANGFGASAVASASYIITAPSAVTPVFTPAAGTYTSAQSVSIMDATSGAAIYYTVDGSTPTPSSAVYSAPISVSQTETVKAIAVAPGSGPSAVASAAYTINAGATAAPIFSPAAGTYSAAQTVTLSDTTAGVAIYYTVDGSTPTTGSTAYSSPITVAQTETIQAIASAPGSGTSSVAMAAYTISAATGGSSLSGTVLSGTAPVKGAQVQLYAASQTDYAAAATPLGSAATTTSTGAFTLSYSCPASPGDLVYVVATGGDSGSGPNPALSLMSALGPCGAITATSTFTVNEATTVASVYALSPFMTGAANVGSSSTNYQGLTNAFATVNNLVNPSTGVVLTITPAYAANPVPFLNSSTVPQSRIDTLADILNGCTASNGAGGGCSNLFSAATPSGTAPTDTLQAMLNIAQNPGANAAALYGLASPNGPFQPELAGAPNDWTLALTFTGAGLGVDPTTAASISLAVIDTYLAIDANGNVWVAAYGDDTPAFPGVDNSHGALLAEFNSIGAPLTPATKLSAATPPVVTFGGYNPEPSATVALTALAFDQTGNLWLGDQPAGNLLEVSSSLSILLPPKQVTSGIAAVAIDSSGNIWVGGEKFGDFQNNGTPILAPTTPDVPFKGLSNITFDSNGGLWTGAANSLTGLDDIFQLSTTDLTILFDAFPGGGYFVAPSLAADGSGNIYGCSDPTGQMLGVFNNSAQTNSYQIASGRGCGNQLVLDGQGHLFAVTNTAGNPAGATVDEFTTAGVAISPANGYTGTSTGEAPTLNPDPNFFGSVPGISTAIDGSGNLWVLNNDTNGSTSPGNVLVEYVGVAAPVITPTSVALTNGLGARP